MQTGVHRPKRPDLIRSRILEACVDLLAGGCPVTMGSVADAAEVTKGAVQHHFGNKSALMRAVFDHVTDSLEGAVSEAEPADNAALRYVRGCFAIQPQPEMLAYHRALLVATVTEESLGQAWAQWVRDHRVSDEGDTAKLIARLAMDGLWLADTMGAYDLTEQEKSNLKHVLERMAQGGNTL